MNVVCSEYGYYHPYYEYRDEYFDETSPKAPEAGKQNIENEFRWVLIIIFFEILIPPEPFMRDAPHFFYRKYNKNLL